MEGIADTPEYVCKGNQIMLLLILTFFLSKTQKIFFLNHSGTFLMPNTKVNDSF